MPKAQLELSGLLDTWGRRNRKLPDSKCPECGKEFHPLRAASRYCSRECAWKNNGGRNRKRESWHVNSKGYIEGWVWLDKHTQIRVKQHRFIMEQILGRPLEPWEDVHHKDGNKQNNDPKNLIVIDHGRHSTDSNLNRTHKKGYKMKLKPEQMEAWRAKSRLGGIAVHAKARSLLAKLEGGSK